MLLNIKSQISVLWSTGIPELAKKGTIVHIYDFSKEDEIPKKTLEKINEVFKKFNKKYELLSWHKCGQNKPREYRICLDIKLKN